MEEEQMFAYFDYVTRAVKERDVEALREIWNNADKMQYNADIIRAIIEKGYPEIRNVNRSIEPRRETYRERMARRRNVSRMTPRGAGTQRRGRAQRERELETL